MIQIESNFSAHTTDVGQPFNDLQKTALSKATVDFLASFDALALTPDIKKLSARAHLPKEGPNIAEALYDASAAAKVSISKIAMFLDPIWRKRLFEQIDELHALEDWEHGTSPLGNQSFDDFLKTMFLLRPKVRPGLGLSINGELLAAWTIGGDQLTLRFYGRSRIRVTYNRGAGNQKESGILEYSLENLSKLIEAINGNYWLQIN